MSNSNDVIYETQTDTADKAVKVKDTETKSPAPETMARNFIIDAAGKGRIFVHWQGKTYAYDGTRYVEVRLETELRAYMLARHWEQTNTRVSNTLPIIQTMVWKNEQQYPVMPFYTGGDAFPQSIIAFKNGLLDVKAFISTTPNTKMGTTEFLRPHTRHWVSTYCLPYDYDPSAICPLWLAFLDEVFDGDAKSIALLQEWVGYCLTGDTSFQKLMVLIGPPRAGKGTTCSIIDCLIGEANYIGYDLYSLADKFGLYRLVNKQVAVSTETILSGKDKHRILATLNSITGEDKVSIERKNDAYVPSLKLPTRFMLLCNDMPSFADPTGALASRMLLLRYKHSHADNPDTTLASRLKGEISGIYNWALEGLVRLHTNKRFTEPADMKEAVEETMRDNSPILAFIQDRLVVQPAMNCGNLKGVRMVDEPREGNKRVSYQNTEYALTLPRKHLIEVYLNWCADGGKEPNVEWLGRNLKCVMPSLRYDKHKAMYYGVDLAELHPQKAETE